MFLSLSESYIAAKFYQYCGKPTCNRAQNTYQGSCPICREGKSWLKKRRCYYLVEKKVICCHNCGWHSSPYNWIARVSGLSNKEIREDYSKFDGDFIPEEQIITFAKKTEQPSLPTDCINLLDQAQQEYYRENTIVQRCIDLIYTRRLNKAVNRPAAFYTTLVDKVHSNRLILPFYDVNGKIIFYQSRQVIENDERPRYLSKVGSERSLYGINNVNSDIGYLFLTEGPIDAMFISNGIGVAGITESSNNNFTATQKSQLAAFPLHEKIWVLDNQYHDTASKTKSSKLLDEGEKVYIWPETFKQYKDINEYCIDKQISSFDVDTILDNTYTGLKGKLLLARY